MMDALISDLRHGARILFQQPAMTLLAVAALSASIGLTTNAFSSFNAFFLKPLPFPQSDQLRSIYTKEPTAAQMPSMMPLHEAVRLAELPAIADILFYYSGTINLSGDGRPQRHEGAFMSTNFLQVLGHQPYLGNGFSANGRDHQGTLQLLISHRLWEDRFHSDSDIIGRSLRANGEQAVIAAVLPPDFHFPVNQDVWLPVEPHQYEATNDEIRVAFGVARRHPDASDADLQEQLDTVIKEWIQQNAPGQSGIKLVAKPLGSLMLNVASHYYLGVFAIVNLLILLVCCANVANLLIGRALLRGRELAIRAAMGATRMRILRQLLSEAMLLAACGAVGGLLIAAWATDWTYENPMWPLPYYLDWSLDWRVFAFTSAVMLLVTFIAGMLPAWQASRIDLNDTLKDSNQTSTGFRLGRMTRLLAVAQIAFSCALLFGAGLMMRQVHLLNSIDPGYPADEILTMRMGLFPGDYPTDADRAAFFGHLLQEVAAIPGVKSAAVTNWLGQFGSPRSGVAIASSGSAKPDFANQTYVEMVSPEHFDVFSLAPISGRLFADGASVREPVVVVNESFVRQFLGGTDPLQESILLTTFSSDDPEANRPLRIIGVVPDVRMSNFVVPDATEPIAYVPFQLAPPLFMTLTVRSIAIDQPSLVSAIQQSILSLDPHLPTYFVQSMREFSDNQRDPLSVSASFFLLIGILALFLAAIGVYGMVAFDVNRQRRDLGVRMALGATTRQIINHVLRRGCIQVVLGILIGTLLAALIGQLARQFLIGSQPLQPAVYLGAILILVATAILAFFLPARRAARLSPLEALRHD